MPFGGLTHVGLAKEATFGTPVAATDYLRFTTEGLTEEIEQVISEQLNATVDEAQSFEGMRTISGDVGFDVYPNELGHVLRSALGAPTTTQVDATNNPTVYQHVFTPAQSPFSNVAALPPYTFEVHRDLEQAFQYTGTVVNDLTLNFGTDNKIMQGSASVIAKALSLITKTTPSFDTTDPFVWNQATISINGTGNNDLQTLDFAVNNSLEGAGTLDGTKEISRIRRTGKRTFPVNLTFDLQDLTEFNRFRSQSEVPAVIELTGATISGTYNYKLTIDIPKLRYTAFPINVGGAEAITAQVTGSAKYDPVSAYGMKVTLTNTASAY
ncbi:phage tail tube protein [Terrihalobacillus insolitus]|uniref:phage tail tube protein n=1 Tax=Terrihalobacillus insolitus TaxID=2950438 RepID=UPI00233FAE84|nr:phage tail tube protein [Terrihalobacillus insolitus]MDC3414266.1 phage tail tube protein [Terrihalobacillus insolitus]